MSKTFELCDRLVSWDCVDINEYKRFYDESIEAGEATYNLSEMHDLTTGAGEKINERLP